MHIHVQQLEARLARVQRKVKLEQKEAEHILRRHKSSSKPEADEEEDFEGKQRRQHYDYCP